MSGVFCKSAAKFHPPLTPLVKGGGKMLLIIHIAAN